MVGKTPSWMQAKAIWSAVISTVGSSVATTIVRPIQNARASRMRPLMSLRARNRAGVLSTSVRIEEKTSTIGGGPVDADEHERSTRRIG